MAITHAREFNITLAPTTGKGVIPTILVTRAHNTGKSILTFVILTSAHDIGERSQLGANMILFSLSGYSLAACCQSSMTGVCQNHIMLTRRGLRTDTGMHFPLQAALTSHAMVGVHSCVGRGAEIAEAVRRLHVDKQPAGVPGMPCCQKQGIVQRCSQGCSYVGRHASSREPSK